MAKKLKLGIDLINAIEELISRIGGSLPIGTIIQYPTSDSTKIPSGYLVCDGSELSRAEYPELFNIIGTSHGAGNGTTTFNLPDLRKRVPVGYDSSDTDFDTMGKTGGEKKHTLSIDEMPKHTHRVYYYINSNLPGGVDHLIAYGSPNSQGLASVEYSGWLGDKGNDQAHNNLQPYIVLNFIIKAKGSTTPAPETAEIVNSYTESNDDTYSCNYINNNYRPTVLYTNSSGTNGNITLNDSILNYGYIEIFFRTNDGAGFRASQKLEVINGTNVTCLIYIHPISGNYYMKIRSVQIIGTQLTTLWSKEIYSGGMSDSNYIYITKILGYK